jgi:hypothetical protein
MKFGWWPSDGGGGHQSEPGKPAPGLLHFRSRVCRTYAGSCHQASHAEVRCARHLRRHPSQTCRSTIDTVPQTGEIKAARHPSSEQSRCEWASAPSRAHHGQLLTRTDQQHPRCSRMRQHDRGCIPDHDCTSHKHLRASTHAVSSTMRDRSGTLTQSTPRRGANARAAAAQNTAVPQSDTHIHIFTCSNGQAHAPCGICTHGAWVAHARAITRR